MYSVCTGERFWRQSKALLASTVASRRVRTAAREGESRGEGRGLLGAELGTTIDRFGWEGTEGKSLEEKELLRLENGEGGGGGGGGGAGGGSRGGGGGGVLCFHLDEGSARGAGDWGREDGGVVATNDGELGADGGGENFVAFGV